MIKIPDKRTCQNEMKLSEFCFERIICNGWWYGVVWEYEAISYQFTPTFFTSHKPSKISETRMHYAMCWTKSRKGGI